jgi:hypothetical protein
MRLGASARTELARRRVWWRDVKRRVCRSAFNCKNVVLMPLYGNRADHRRDYDRRRGIGANDETDMRVGHRRHALGGESQRKPRSPSAAAIIATRAGRRRRIL